VDKLLIDSSSRQRASTFFECHGFYQEEASVPWIIRRTLLTGLQLKFRTLNHLWKKNHIPVQDSKNCSQQWPKSWEHCKELEGDYFEKF
jgi:hypothetical protein